jgi:ABC-type polysaccharide/polyol phosphate transport system ATPase subunit
MSKEEVILSINDFSIKYEHPRYNTYTLRDKFIEIVKTPVDFFFNSKDMQLVLDKISFDVCKGDIVGLMGVNGVGKTSLCRYLAGIIKSKEIQGIGHIRAIFETNISFYTNLSGYENAVILVEMLYSEYNAQEKKKIIQEALEFSELNDFIHVPINRYSKGMKARLYLSLVTARVADLIILDEIFGGTDIFFAEKLFERMKALISKSGAAVIVSHDINDISAFCNRVIILDNKKIHFDGEMEKGIEVYKNIKA